MLDLTFLTEEQIFGNSKLEILKKYGTRCAITDFSILLGGFVSSDYYTSEGNTLKNRTGWWWTKTSYGDDVRVVLCDGDRTCYDVDIRHGGARPALPYSSISKISSNVVASKTEIKEILYGEYPQWVVDENYSHELEKSYSNGCLKTTEKNYTTDSVKYHYTNTNFRARFHTEYEYNGRKYIRIIGDCNGNGKELSDGREVESGKPYWIRVEPITWLVDERANIVFSKYILFSGVQFKNRRDYKGDFENADIKLFMDKYFTEEIIVGANALNIRGNIKTDSTDNIDDIFNEAISRMNEINSKAKTKILK